MLSCFKYLKKEVKKVSLEEVSFANNEYFIDAEAPTNKEIKQLANKTGITVSDLSYCLKEHVRPTIQNRKNYSLVTFKKVSDHKVSDMCVFISRKFVLVVRQDKSEGISEVFKSSKSGDLSSWFARGLPYFMFRILLAVSRAYTKKINDVSIDVEKIEQRIFLKGSFKEDMKQLFYHKKALFRYREALIKNKDNIEDLTEGVLDFVKKQDIEYYSALKIELAEITGIIDNDIRNVQDAIDLHIGMQSNQLNEVLRGFTVIATIILFPTLISGIWGMNFANIPFFDHGYGFFIPIILMIISIIILYIYFKAKKWA